MKKQIISSLRMLLGLTILTGLIYPLLVTGIAQAFFPKQAGGSLIERNGQVIGSKLIGQKFESERYFWGRPSAVDYNPLPSGAGNQGPTSKKLSDAFTAAKTKMGAGAPGDLLFASASGLDPDISPEAGLFQVPRVAKARGLAESEVRRLVNAHIQSLDLGFLGQRRLNVLALNLELDRLGDGGEN